MRLYAFEKCYLQKVFRIIRGAYDKCPDFFRDNQALVGCISIAAVVVDLKLKS